MEQLEAKLLEIIVPTAATVFSILMAWAIAELRRFIKTRTQSEAADQAFSVLADLIHAGVAAVNQTARKTFEDGKLTDHEKAAFKTTVINFIENQLPSATRKILEAQVKNLDLYVNTRIEQVVGLENECKKEALK